MGRASPAIGYLHELFRLDASGRLIRRQSTSPRAQAGAVAGCLGTMGYRYICVSRKKILEHRVVFAMSRGYWPEHDVDHINGDRADNRPENLRAATRSENLCNKRDVSGVTWFPRYQKWQPQIQINHRHIYLGRYVDRELAQLVYDEARRKYHGEFARAA